MATYGIGQSNEYGKPITYYAVIDGERSGPAFDTVAQALEYCEEHRRICLKFFKEAK